MTFRDGSRNFEPCSSDEDNTLAGNSSNYHTNGRTYELSTDLMCFASQQGGSSVVLGSNSGHFGYESDILNNSTFHKATIEDNKSVSNNKYPVYGVLIGTPTNTQMLNNNKTLSIACKCSMVIAVYREARYTNGQRALNREGLFYVTTKDRQMVVVVKGIVMEGMGRIRRRYHTFRKQKANHCPPRC
ncbi:hypothetical protein TNCV_4750901 [Trichonephila clavipes]|nr:hypothetical protein TNCV_4750901 [Trichonephila clavipes]